MIRPAPKPPCVAIFLALVVQPPHRRSPVRCKRLRPRPSAYEGNPGRATCGQCRAQAGLLVTPALYTFSPLGTHLGQPDKPRARLAAELLASLAHPRGATPAPGISWSKARAAGPVNARWAARAHRPPFCPTALLLLRPPHAENGQACLLNGHHRGDRICTSPPLPKVVSSRGFTHNGVIGPKTLSSLPLLAAG
jgi:hypothetical protein